MQVKAVVHVMLCLMLLILVTHSSSPFSFYSEVSPPTAPEFEILRNWISNRIYGHQEDTRPPLSTVEKPEPKSKSAYKTNCDVDVGMWYVNTYNHGNPDATLNNSIPDLKRLWDGHPEHPVRACNLVQTGGGGEHWGYLPGQPRAKREAHGYNEWLRCLHQANSDGRSIKSLVFRPLWGLRKARDWSLSEIESMTALFLEMSARTGTLDSVAGWLLGDDFTDYSYHTDWDKIVKIIHEQQQKRQLNKPFYFTNQIFADDIWSNRLPRGYRLRKFRKWLKVFNEIPAIPVFVPQYYPWASSKWDKRPRPGQYKWWKEGLDELRILKHSYCPTLRVQPIIQGSALKIDSGPKHVDIRNQLRTVLDHPITDGVWILGWRPLGVPGNPVFWASRENWTTGINIAEAIQIEVAHSEKAK